MVELLYLNLTIMSMGHIDQERGPFFYFEPKMHIIGNLQQEPDNMSTAIQIRYNIIFLWNFQNYVEFIAG